MDKIILRAFHPDDAPWIIEQHGLLYGRDEGFDQSFAPLVAEIVEGVIATHDPEAGRGWIAERGGTRLGSIFCVRLSEDSAKLRLFLVMPEARGIGLGHLLLRTCMQFARDCDYRRMQLWTHESHRAACALYQKTGWHLVSARPVHSFGRDLVEQSWEITL
ncbi:MAG: GNAT family N-acetyltransferase [Roseovarius sp.]|jgi:GNAT superfamily N-acetyltransferase|nr:GNAT family N-acetyltransferase [Roseovarius sp.]